jgi:acetate kinase
VRAGAVRGLEFLGVTIDPDANAARSDAPRSISPAGSAVTVLVVPTDEELEIAQQTARLLG